MGSTSACFPEFAVLWNENAIYCKRYVSIWSPRGCGCLIPFVLVLIRVWKSGLRLVADMCAVRSKMGKMRKRRDER